MPKKYRRVEAKPDRDLLLKKGRLLDLFLVHKLMGQSTNVSRDLAIVICFANGEGRGDDLRTLVQRDAELSEILMRAFILRRTALMSQDNDDLVLLGSRHSDSTQHIREFLSRNGQPVTYEDVETDPSVQVLLDRFHIGVNDVPVIVCRGGHILKNRNPSTTGVGGRPCGDSPPRELADGRSGRAAIDACT